VILCANDLSVEFPSRINILRFGKRNDSTESAGEPEIFIVTANAAREGRPGLPALFITGYEGSALEGQLAPGIEVIGKPFALNALAAKVGAMLEAALAA